MQLSISTVAVLLVMAIAWAGGLAGVYFGLKGRVVASEGRMDNLSRRLDDGSEKFASIESVHRDHSARLVRLETMLGGIDSKLDIVVSELRHHS